MTPEQIEFLSHFDLATLDEDVWRMDDGRPLTDDERELVGNARAEDIKAALHLHALRLEQSQAEVDWSAELVQLVTPHFEDGAANFGEVRDRLGPDDRQRLDELAILSGFADWFENGGAA